MFKVTVDDIPNFYVEIGEIIYIFKNNENSSKNESKQENKISKYGSLQKRFQSFSHRFLILTRVQILKEERKQSFEGFYF